MPKPFISHLIDRFGDTAMVKIVRVTFTDEAGNYKTETLEHYETLSRGATASARKSAKKYR
jgi:hypothetical protein